MKRFIAVSLAFMVLALASHGEKIVLDQSQIITRVNAHSDTVWTDGVRTIASYPVRRDTVVPVVSTVKDYPVDDSLYVGDTLFVVDTNWNYFTYTTRKKGAREIPLDTIKVKRIQPGSSIRNKTMVY